MCVAAVQLVVLQKCLEEATLPLRDPFIYTRGGETKTKNKKKLYYITVLVLQLPVVERYLQIVSI